MSNDDCSPRPWSPAETTTAEALPPAPSQAGHSPAVAHAINALNDTAFVSKARLAELERAERRLLEADRLANVTAAIAVGLRELAAAVPGAERLASSANVVDAAVDAYRAAR